MVDKVNWKAKAIAEFDEAVRELMAAYAQYENLIYLVNDIKAMDDNEKQLFKKVTNNMRIYETHAHLRLQTLFPKATNEFKEITELRQKIKQTVPNQEDAEKLVLEYNKVKAKTFTDTSFYDNL